MNTLTDTELSRAVAEKLGWIFTIEDRWTRKAEHYPSLIFSYDEPPYATDGNLMLELLARLTERCGWYLVSHTRPQGNYHIELFNDGVALRRRIYADTPQRAVCLAVLAMEE